MKPQVFLGLVATASTVLAQNDTLSNKPTTEPQIDQITDQGCFNSSVGLELIHENLEFNSDGKCGEECQRRNRNVGATHGAQECWCGDQYPPKENLVDDSECNMGCTGFREVACGGLDTWSVYNTGLKLAVQNSDPLEVQGDNGNDPSQPSSISNESDGDGSSGGNSRTIGIAVGSVAAVLLVGGGVGGLLWYLRKKRNQEIEEEHRRNAAVNAFIGGSQPPGSSEGSISMTDSRLDPIMAHHRLSDGSIADNQDYSRKILRVTNA